MGDLPEQVAQALGADPHDLSDYQRQSAKAISDYVGTTDPDKAIAAVHHLETKLGSSVGREARLERVYRYVKLQNLMH